MTCLHIVDIMQARMKRHQFTVRNVPDSISRALKRQASDRKVSLNSLLLSVLEREAGVGGEPARHHDLDHLAGTWVVDKAVDRALASQRSVDPRDWK